MQTKFVNLSTLDVYWSWDKLGREDWLEVLCKAKWSKLTGLVLHGRLDYQEMSHLPCLTSLTKLDLSSMEIEERGMNYLTRLSNLTSLNLKYSKVGDCRFVTSKTCFQCLLVASIAMPVSWLIERNS